MSEPIEYTGGNVEITPDFVYTEPVATIAAFIQKLRKVAYKEDSDALVGEIVQSELYGVVEALRGILTQDIELQIANKTFPLSKRAHG